VALFPPFLSPSLPLSPTIPTPPIPFWMTVGMRELIAFRHPGVCPSCWYARYGAEPGGCDSGMDLQVHRVVRAESPLFGKYVSDLYTFGLSR
jgi:hypothetical protein